MNSSTTDKVKGTLHEASGKVKEEVGKATGNQDLHDRGTVEKAGGTVERKVGEVKQVFGK
ncbi:MAG: CsbD family protein [Verrucomicrobiota bacterium]|nr:CsbD family protein [Verrucomicrobiota bacterium]